MKCAPTVSDALLRLQCAGEAVCGRAPHRRCHPDFEWPELIEGDTVRFGLRFAQTLGDEELENERSVRLVRASLGRPDTRPDDGHWRMCSASRLYCEDVSSSENAIRAPEKPGIVKVATPEGLRTRLQGKSNPPAIRNRIGGQITLDKTADSKKMPESEPLFPYLPLNPLQPRPVGGGRDDGP